MTSRDRRALLVGAAAIAAAMLLLRGLPLAWQAHRALRERVEATADRVVRLREELAGTRAMEDSAGVLRERMLALAPKILTGASDAGATADLIARLRTTGEAHRVRLERADPLPDSTRAAALGRVSVRVVLESDTRGTLELLRALERGQLVLSLADLRIVAPDPAAGAPAPEALRTELTASGWYLRHAPRTGR